MTRGGSRDRTARTRRPCRRAESGLDGALRVLLQAQPPSARHCGSPAPTDTTRFGHRFSNRVHELPRESSWPTTIPSISTGWWRRSSAPTTSSWSPPATTARRRSRSHPLQEAAGRRGARPAHAAGSAPKAVLAGAHGRRRRARRCPGAGEAGPVHRRRRRRPHECISLGASGYIAKDANRSADLRRDPQRRRGPHGPLGRGDDGAWPPSSSSGARPHTGCSPRPRDEVLNCSPAARPGAPRSRAALPSSAYRARSRGHAPRPIATHLLREVSRRHPRPRGGRVAKRTRGLASHGRPPWINAVARSPSPR